MRRGILCYISKKDKVDIMTYGFNRRPLFEAVKKHATSGTFLTAIICTFIYIGASCLLMGTTVSFMLDILNLTYKAEPDIVFPYVVYALLGFIGIMFIGSLVISILMTTKLLSVRSFFKGKSDNPNGLAGFIKLTKATYIYSSIVVGIPIIIMIIILITAMIASMGISGIIATLLFVLPIYGAEIAGIVILYYFTFKGIRNTVNYAINAMNGIPEGKVSVFIIVMTIISLASAAFLVMYSVIIVIAGSLLSFVEPDLWVEFSPIASMFDLFSVMPFVSVPLLISQICYVKLLFGFKKDMEIAKKEHTHIQQQVFAFNAQNTADNSSESFE